MPLDPRDRMFGDLIARVRQIERRAAAQGVVAAKVSKVTNTTVVNNARKSCSLVNLARVDAWTVVGTPELMHWEMNREEEGFSLFTEEISAVEVGTGVEVEESGWHRITASIYGETDTGAVASGRVLVDGVQAGGFIHLGMDEDPFHVEDGFFFDDRTTVVEVELDAGAVVKFEMTAEDSGSFDTPAGTSFLIVEKL